MALHHEVLRTDCSLHAVLGISPLLCTPRPPELCLEDKGALRHKAAVLATDAGYLHVGRDGTCGNTGWP